MSAQDGLPPLGEIIRTHGLSAKKALGQNFLLDLNLTGRIARAAGSLEGKTIVEVGPGPGGLTRALLSNGAERVIAIERDERCLSALQEISEHWPDKLSVVQGDALEFDWKSLSGEDIKIVANLPYNVGTQLLTKWITNQEWPPFFSSLTLMFQREVAERICAEPGSAHYGRLSVLCGWRTRAEKVFDVSPKAFTPPPKVTSSIVHIEPNPSPLPCELKKLETITRAAFGQRRKMLRASLKSLGGEDLLKTAEIEPTLRAEQLTIEEFVRLSSLL
jgi:16S rRNA (adenine1518-N6/adenine1519-N6)-dimethyltransferase